MAFELLNGGVYFLSEVYRYNGYAVVFASSVAISVSLLAHFCIKSVG